MYLAKGSATQKRLSNLHKESVFAFPMPVIMNSLSFSGYNNIVVEGDFQKSMLFIFQCKEGVVVVCTIHF